MKIEERLFYTMFETYLELKGIYPLNINGQKWNKKTAIISRQKERLRERAKDMNR